MNNRSFNNELADTGFIAPRLLADGRVQLQNKTATAVNNLVTTDLGNIVTNTADWFRFVITYTPTDPNAGTYDVKTEVFNAGPDGTAAGTNILSDTRSVTNVTFNLLNAGTTAWAGLRSNSTNPTYDNFVVDGAVIPEPSGLGLAGLAALGMLARRRVG
jgi:MYXO-CTERM domain-containing protein